MGKNTFKVKTPHIQSSALITERSSKMRQEMRYVHWCLHWIQKRRQEMRYPKNTVKNSLTHCRELKVDSLGCGLQSDAFSFGTGWKIQFKEPIYQFQDRIVWNH